ncbi:MAG: hypothetical protein IJ555_09960 [Ruminococcus sp.]|nr:hypothetical protein [Ruminococcus sp.]MBR1750329.1 hypothetical protein [Ruminococcus sp.]
MYIRAYEGRSVGVYIFSAAALSEVRGKNVGRVACPRRFSAAMYFAVICIVGRLMWGTKKPRHN